MKIELRKMVQADIPKVRPWLVDPDNAKWLDPFFQNQGMSDVQLALFLMKTDRITYVVTCDGVPVGIMGLTSIDAVNKSAEVWSLVGDRDYRRKGIYKQGLALTLKKAFSEVGLHSLHAWGVKDSFTVRVCERVGFRVIGRQRECHLMGGEFKDRIMLDMLEPDFVQATSEMELK